MQELMYWFKPHRVSFTQVSDDKSLFMLILRDAVDSTHDWVEVERFAYDDSEVYIRVYCQHGKDVIKRFLGGLSGVPLTTEVAATITGPKTIRVELRELA